MHRPDRPRRTTLVLSFLLCLLPASLAQGQFLLRTSDQELGSVPLPDTAILDIRLTTDIDDIHVVITAETTDGFVRWEKLRHFIGASTPPLILEQGSFPSGTVFPDTSVSRNGDYSVRSSTAPGSALGNFILSLGAFMDDQPAGNLMTNDIPTVTFPSEFLQRSGVGVGPLGKGVVGYTKLENNGDVTAEAQFFDLVSNGFVGLPLALAVNFDLFSLKDVRNLPGFFFVGLSNAIDVFFRKITVSSSGNVTLGDQTAVNSTPAPATGFLEQVTSGTSPGPPAPAPTADDTASSTARFGAGGTVFFVWRHVTFDAGNLADIRGRVFDIEGTPLGPDFIVNSTTAGDQGQPDVACDLQGSCVVAWSGPSQQMNGGLDVFVQAFDAAGQPLGSETRVHQATAGVQDKPSVDFVPAPDGQGRPQFVVGYRNVGQANGTQAIGTGAHYGLFSIDPRPINLFSDGFENGDLTAWSSTQP